MPSQKAPIIIFGACILLAFGVMVLFANGFFESKQKISQGECVLFAKEIERSIDYNDPSFLNNALNHHAFLKKVAGKFGAYNKSQLSKLSFQVKDNIRFGDMVMSYLKSNDGYFNFTKLYFENDIPHIIFRIYSQIEGLNYFDCELERINGQLNITDVFIYYSGELWSTSYTRHMKLMGEYNKGGYENIHPENEFYNSLLKIDFINELLFAGEIEQAEMVYSTIPEQFQNDKIIQGTALKIASKKSDSAYVEAIKEYLINDPKNETFNLFFGVLRQLTANENNKARQSITDLKKFTGEDLLMDLFIGQTFQNEQNFKKSIIHFDNVIEHYPDLFETYWYKLVSLIKLNHFEKAVTFLDTIINNFEARKIDLEDLLAKYPDFINSKAYLDWRNRINI